MAYWDKPGASDEWYTPPHVFAAMGLTFDLDVAPARLAEGHVTTSRKIAGDGLAEPWDGTVWMNPPFGGRNGIAPWLAKFFEHRDGVALTPDRTSAPWFQDHWTKAEIVLFTRKIRFLRPDGSEGVSPSNGTALWGIGPVGYHALCDAAERGLGIIAEPRRMSRGFRTTLPPGLAALSEKGRE